MFSPDLYLMRRVRKSIVLNNAIWQTLIKKGIDRENLEMIPNGINTLHYGNFDQRRIMNIKTQYDLIDRNIVLFVGTITPRKGVFTMVKAAERILKQGTNQDICFLFVGNLT